MEAKNATEYLIFFYDYNSHLGTEYGMRKYFVYFNNDSSEFAGCSQHAPHFLWPKWMNAKNEIKKSLTKIPLI